MKIKESYLQFIKFVAVGLLNTAIDWIVFFLLQLINFFSLYSPLAKAISFLIAAVNSFFLNSYWTFKKEFKSSLAGSEKNKLAKGSVYFGRFFAVSLVGWVINTLTYTIAFSALPHFLPSNLTKIGSLALASAAGIIWNFFANKYWTYKKIETAVDSDPVERRKRQYFNIIGVVLLSIMAAVSVILAKTDSAIVDEIAHIPSGYSYDKYQDYRLNPEHPPLAKALAGIPLTFMSLKQVDQSAAWNDVNQWEAGWDFIYRFNSNYDTIIFVSRLPMILLLLALGFFVYRFAAQLFGRRTAVITLALFCSYPDLLAHGHLVTTDVAAALGFMISVYYFYHWNKSKTTKSLVYAGIAFGLAQLLKFSAVLLLPILLIYIIYLALEKKKAIGSFWKAFWPKFRDYICIGLIGLGVVYLFYLIFCWHTPSGIEHKLIETNLTNDPRTLVFRNFLHLFENNPVTRALGHYILGLFLVFGRVGGGNNTFILGHYSNKSISWFFPVAYLIKTPLPVIVLFFGGLISLYWSRMKDAWIKVLLLTPIIIYWAVTLKGSLNIGIRHLMPTIPFVLLFIAYFIHKYLITAKLNWKNLVIYALTLWMIVGSVAAYPNYISYFNETTIGHNRYDLMVDSSLDWGQDLKRLKTYVDENHISSIYADYFGGGVPGLYIPQEKDWHAGNGPVTGWIAISAEFYQFSKMTGPVEGKWSYGWLDSYKPRAVIGNSILVFYINPADFLKHPPTSPYPIIKYDTPATTNSNAVGSPPAQIK